MEPITVVVRRGGIEEARHLVHAVAVQDGAVVAEAGDADLVTFLRSSAKPFQALPLVRARKDLTTEEIAIAAASHLSSPEQLAAVRSLLAKAPATEDELECGAEPTPIEHNCSGKHAGMLAVCAHEGLDTGGYRRPDHPLQRRIMDLLTEVCGLRQDEVLLAGDDCGVPAFALPLKNLATGFVRLATGEGLSDEVAAAAERVRSAMRAHPFTVAGTGRLDTEVMEVTDLLCKSGAEGVFAAGSPDGWGLSLKTSDGGGRAVRPAAFAALSRRGVEVVDNGPESRPTRGLHGEVVGEIGPLL